LIPFLKVIREILGSKETKPRSLPTLVRLIIPVNSPFSVRFCRDARLIRTCTTLLG